MTHVVNCAFGLQKHWPKFKPTFPAAYLQLPWSDSADQELHPALEEAFAFLEQCRVSGGVAFVHCAQGVSRSGALVVYTLMRRHGIPYADALAMAQRGRSIVLPNENFARQLSLLSAK